MLWILGYAAVLIGLGVFYFIKNGKQSFGTFVVFERKAGWFTVGMSLVALVFGASAVFGMSGLTQKLGWNALWWTLSGVLFLCVLAFTFAKTVWESKSITQGDIIARAFGPEVRVFVSFILFLAWLMVLAGQIVAGANILNLLIKDMVMAYVVFTLIFTAYTVLAGQSAVIKTGWIQSVLMIAGLAAIFIFEIFALKKNLNVKAASFGITPDFKIGAFLALFIPVGLSYLFGPDMYSRIFSAKDPKNARSGLLFGAGMIVLVSVLIVWIGVLSKKVLGGSIGNPDNIIPLLFGKMLKGGWVSSLVLVALVSIPLSGADIILMTASTAFGKDILFPLMEKLKLKKPNTYPLWLFRIVLVLLAAAAALIAFKFRQIIPALLVSYKIFTVGIVPLLFISLLAIMLKLDLKGLVYRVFAGIYIFIISALVLFIEMKWITVRVPNYNLWLTGINTVVLTLGFLLPAFIGRKKAPPSPVKPG